MSDLSGRRALVTGGGRGIGAAVVRRLAADGAAVAVNYRSSATDAEELVSELTRDGRRAVALKADVSDPPECASLVARTVEALGGLDILVSNAGVEHFGSLDSITPDDVTRVFGTNVGAQLFVTQAAAAAMEPGGRIVLTSSVSAGRAIFEHSLYAASKAAVSALAANLAPELAHRGIAINAIAPGGTRSDMQSESGPKYVNPALHDIPGFSPEVAPKLATALGRVAEPAEIAAVVSFLVSSDASYMTGTTVAVDGGRL